MMTRSTNTPAHNKTRLANKIRECVNLMANSEDIQKRITAMQGDKSLEEMEERDLRNILNATHNKGIL